MDINATIREASDALRRGNLALADVLCEGVMLSGKRDLRAVEIKGLVALRVGDSRTALAMLGEAAAGMPGDDSVADELMQAHRAAKSPPPRPEERFLVIKAWGSGFCSDLDHVLGALLLAEMTDRTPVIDWGEGSLFCDAGDSDGWGRFFEPLNEHSVQSLRGHDYSYFPPKWTDENIQAAEVDKFSGEWSRMGACHYVNRPEQVLVTDFFLSMPLVARWLPEGHAIKGVPLPEVYRRLIANYVRLRPSIAAEVDAFVQQHFTTGTTIAVHGRGGDKVVEDSKLPARIEAMHATIEFVVKKHPAARVFLLTDDSLVRAAFAARYGEKLITTECVRTSNQEGVHYQEHHSRSRLGVEVLVDMYAAARCDYFVGVGTSNVSAMIEHLKVWARGTIEMNPPSMHYSFSPFLYRHPIAR